MPTGLTRPRLTDFADVPYLDRIKTGYEFANMTASQMAAMLKDAADGRTERFAMWCEYALETDPDLANPYRTRKLRVARSDYVVEPGQTGDPARDFYAQKAADDFLRQLDGIPERGTRFLELLDGIGVGWSISEIMWGYSGGEVVIGELKWRHARRFRFDGEYRPRLYDWSKYSTAGSTLGNKGPWDSYGVPLPKDKFVVHMPVEHNGYATRNGALMKLSWIWLFTQWARKFHIQYLEKYAAPFVYGKVPPRTPESARNAFLDALENLAIDHAAVIEQDGEIVIEAAAAAASKGEAYENYLRLAKEMKTAAMLGATDAVDPGAHGSQSAIEERAGISTDPIMESDGAQLCGTLVEQLAKPYYRFNLHRYGGQMPPIPTMRFAFQIESKRASDQAITAGAVSINEIREADGLDRLEDPRYDQPLFELRAEQQAAQATPFAEPAGGQAADAPFPMSQRASSSKLAQTGATASPTRSGSRNPLSAALSHPLAGPAKPSPAPRSAASPRSKGSASTSPVRRKGPPTRRRP